MLPEAIEKQWN